MAVLLAADHWTGRAVVKMMKTVEVVAGRVCGRSTAHTVRWRHGHGRIVHVELIGERGVQFGHDGRDCGTANGGIDVILAGRRCCGRSCSRCRRRGRFVIPALLLLMVLLLLLLLLLMRLVMIIHVVQRTRVVLVLLVVLLLMMNAAAHVVSIDRVPLAGGLIRAGVVQIVMVIVVTTSGCRCTVTSTSLLLLLVRLTVVVTDGRRNVRGLLVRVTATTRLVTVVVVTVTVLLLCTVSLILLAAMAAHAGLLLYPTGTLNGRGRSGLGLVRRRRRWRRRSFRRHVPTALRGRWIL